MNKNEINVNAIYENDEVYKYFCEYRYQATTVLLMERIKLNGEVYNLKGNINVYLSGTMLLLTMFAIVIAIGGMGITEYLNIVKLHMKILVGTW